jgi:hypothetical protein
MEPQPGKGNLVRRLKWMQPISVVHGDDEIQIMAFPVDWDEAFDVHHGGETTRVHIHPCVRANGSSKGASFHLVFSGPRSFVVVPANKRGAHE